MSLIITFGFVTTGLGILWAGSKTWFASQPMAKLDVIEIIEDVEGGGAEDGVLDSSLEAPGPESLTEEPSEAFDPDDIVSDFPEMEETISSVLSAVTTAVRNPKHLRSARETLYSPPPSQTLNDLAVRTRPQAGSRRSITSPRESASHRHSSAVLMSNVPIPHTSVGGVSRADPR